MVSKLEHIQKHCSHLNSKHSQSFKATTIHAIIASTVVRLQQLLRSCAWIQSRLRALHCRRATIWLNKMEKNLGTWEYKNRDIKSADNFTMNEKQHLHAWKQLKIDADQKLLRGPWRYCWCLSFFIQAIASTKRATRPQPQQINLPSFLE